MSKHPEKNKLYPTLELPRTLESEDSANAEETVGKADLLSHGGEHSSGRLYNLRPRTPLQEMRTSTKRQVDAQRSPHRSRSSEHPSSGAGGGGSIVCPGSPGGSNRSPAEALLGSPDQTDGVRRRWRPTAGSSPEQSSESHSEDEEPLARPTSARLDRRTPPGGRPIGWKLAPSQLPDAPGGRPVGWNSASSRLPNAPSGRPVSWNSASSRLPNASSSAPSKVGSQLPPPGWVVGAVAVVVVLLALAWYLSSSETPSVGLRPQSVSPAVGRWVDAVAALSAQFPFQRPGLWRVLRATVSRMLLQGWQPAVLVLAGGEEQRDELACLTSAVADAVRRATGSQARPVTLNGTELARLEAAEAKGRVVAALDSLRGRDDSGAAVDLVVVHDLQRLRPLTAMLLHGFTDNDNAPRKQAVFLLQVVTSPPPPASQGLLPAAVEAQLGRAWRPALSEEIFDALLGRIAGNVVAVAEEGDALACKAHV